MRILVREDLHNNKLVGDTWSLTDSMRNLKCVLADGPKHKSIVNQLYSIEAFLQANRVFVKLDSRYSDYFPEYAK